MFVLQGGERMKYKLLKDLYDCFYIPPELQAQKQEIEECHQALSEVLGKPERRLVLQIIDAKDRMRRIPPSTALSPDLNWRGSCP